MVLQILKYRNGMSVFNTHLPHVLDIVQLVSYFAADTASMILSTFAKASSVNVSFQSC